MSMSFCELCSRPVPAQSFNPKRCLECSGNAPLPSQACSICGTHYPRLRGDTCFACFDAAQRAELEYQNGFNARLQQRMDVPMSAVQMGQNRHRRPKGNGINPEAYAGSDPVYRSRAESMVMGLQQAYNSAVVQNQSSQNRPVQGAKVYSSFSAPVPIPAMKTARIHVQIAMVKCGKTLLEVTPFQQQFPGSELWGVVEQKMKNMTIQAVRECNDNLYVKKSQASQNTFPLIAKVNQPAPPKAYTADGSSRAHTTAAAARRPAATKRQRPNDDDDDDVRVSETRPPKRAYKTIPPPKREDVTVTESRLVLTTGSESRSIEQLPDETGIIVSVDKEASCHGASKEVFKLYRIAQSGEIWAAKRFLDIGPGNAFGIVNAAANENELRMEMTRQLVVCDLLTDFLKDIGEAVKFAIPEIRVSIPTTMRVNSGEMAGSVYLVDRWLPGDFIKFSTNVEAGASGSGDHLSFASLCDAFPHWTLATAGLAVVDIQGIFTLEVGNEGIQKKVLTLFDLMIHSEEERFGLGDEGQKGIDSFKSQHRCNRVCEWLELNGSDEDDD
ncbi:kinase-like protein [Exidia glandulosa HHB12029]|uniref:Kinase-like protein n=1 Tax=Exidia glandulosa HHB12029 TaxID=1314781 RepID=A0A166MU11_EXIGL|nr:kinase-like protein [Exidia glandulosa HHB12029]